MQHLTPGQQALLKTALDQRLRQLDRRVTEHHQGTSRAEHAHQVLEQDGDDAPQREGEREIDFAISDLEARELDAVGAALARIERGQYGVCADCGTTIPFDRLKAEPWALRCVECATAAEARRR